MSCLRKKTINVQVTTVKLNLVQVKNSGISGIHQYHCFDVVGTKKRKSFTGQNMLNLTTINQMVTEKRPQVLTSTVSLLGVCL